MRSNFMLLLLLLIINVKYRYTDTVAAEEQQYCNVIFSDVEYHKNISVYWQLVWVTISKIKQRLNTIPFDRIEYIAAADSFFLFSFSFS